MAPGGGFTEMTRTCAGTTFRTQLTFSPGHLAAVLASGLAALLVLTVLAVAGPASKGRKVAIMSRPIVFDPRHPQSIRFGALTWRGGIEIWSKAKEFGGFSGLVVSADGKRLVAVSDRARWFTAKLSYRDGRLAAMRAGRMAAMNGPDGRRLRRKRDSDAESITRDGDDGYLVAFERNDRILRYNFSKSRPSRPRKISLPAALATAPYNKSIEAIGRFAPSGRLGNVLIVIAEHMLDDNGNTTGWLLGKGPARRFTVKRIGDFDVTDLAILPNGDVVTLERRFTILSGPGVMMRRIAHDTIRAGAILDGPVLLRADAAFSIDNMEGLAVHRASNGELRLTLISDDNFNVLQRTLVMQFALTE